MYNTNKKKKTKTFIYKLISIILSIITIIFISSIITLNILNLPLLILILFIIIIISGITILLTLNNKLKKIGLSIAILLIIIFSIIIFFISKTTKFLTNLDLNYKTYNYSVLVKNTTNYNKLSHLNNLKLGYYDDNSPETNEALNKILKKVKLEHISYQDNHTLANSLLTEEIDAILLENSYIDILNETLTYNNTSFNNHTKQIYEFSIITNTKDFSKDINVVKEPFNIYISGIDTYGEISSVSRSDVNMVISINPDTRQILLTSLPRDYYIKLHNKSGYRDKLTHAGLYGTDMSIKTIEDLLDININYYVKVNFSSIIKIVNAIDGINVYSDYAFTSIDNYKYNKGYNDLNGEKALSFARERKAFMTGDRQRIKNQQAIFRAIFKKCLNKDIIIKYTKILDSLEGSFVTNMPMTRMTSLVKMQLSKNYSWNIVTNSLEGTDSANYTYSSPKYKSYVMIPKEESVSYASELIKYVEEGQILNEKLMNNIGEQVVFKEQAGLKVKLIRTNITMNKGEDYIYHGYTATYNNEDITKDKNLKEKFTINNKTFSDYKELIRYITYNLNSGNYIIKYTITYKNETKELSQNLFIK